MTKQLQLTALTNFPLIEPGDSISSKIITALEHTNDRLRNNDCLVVAQKVISKAENRYAYLNDITPSGEANEYAEKTAKDPRLVELILRESNEVLRWRTGLLIVEHRLGYVHANAGIDESNIRSDAANPRVLLLPLNPDASAKQLRIELRKLTGADVNIIISDSAGRAWRNGIVGFAIATSGFEAVIDKVGVEDLFGKALQTTSIAIADEIAAAASLLMGQANEGQPVVLVRGLNLNHSNRGSAVLLRDKSEDLFR